MFDVIVCQGIFILYLLQEIIQYQHPRSGTATASSQTQEKDGTRRGMCITYI